jgi:hypothetical protein
MVEDAVSPMRAQTISLDGQRAWMDIGNLLKWASVHCGRVPAERRRGG